MTRSAYGLDSGAEVDWRRKGACAQGVWPADWWTNRDSDWQFRRWAMWVCYDQCPVRLACRQWAERNLDLADQAVYGGVWWSRSRTHTNRRYGPVRPMRYTPEKPPPGWLPAGSRSQPQPCGTRAAAHRHRERGEPVCGPCGAAERAYDQARGAA